MIDNTKLTDIIPEDTKKQIYEDGLQPAVKATGSLLGLIPRAIHAALQPLELWTQQREFNIEQTKKLLEKELESVSPEKIVTPEPYVAVPALQAISYCMDSEELRTMYAKLLAKAMNSEIKSNAHPSFVDIIKQLSPVDAKVLAYINIHEANVKLYAYASSKEVTATQKLLYKHYSFAFSDFCSEDTAAVSISNLERLGLINPIYQDYILTSQDNYYKELSEKKRYAKFIKSGELEITIGLAHFTMYGREFCNVCI